MSTLPTLGTYSFESINYPDYHIRLRGGELVIDFVRPADRDEAAFELVTSTESHPDSRCVSIVKQVRFNRFFLRHEGFRLKTALSRNDRLFRGDSSFWLKHGNANPKDPQLVSFESYNFPGKYIRHKNYKLYVESGEGDLFKADSTFRVKPPL